MNTNSDFTTMLDSAGLAFEIVFDGDAGGCPCHAPIEPLRRPESQVAA